MTSADQDPIPILTHLDHGITVIETGYLRPGYDCAYLIVDEGRAAFIDTGVNASVPRLHQALTANGLGPGAVDWVLLTHVHLDHAGGAGLLMSQLPNARLGVHPRGVRHIADPSMLMKAVRDVYGDDYFEREYGVLPAVSAARIEALGDGDSIVLGGRTLSVIEAPGHARHHICIWDEISRSWFTGDAFGLCLREFRGAHGHAVVPTTSPSQFEPEAFPVTIKRLLERLPRAVFPTHSGEVLHPERLAPFLLAQVEAQIDVARSIGAGTDGVERMCEAFTAIYLEALHAQGWQGDAAAVREAMGIDIELNVQGVRIWLDRALAAVAR